eukprot:CAMPEP_0116544744 /NCGR_PEP_ID=MMETSP0397-20121206/2282_1 /TAXON_ID=216820 /ORGANISM="Cyclophora tenuis, Strain ECT3854" /LENGTH=221 /DNA_ID=CAMNT_0004068979 /DNA_START=77 /DNA_END=743 /DNA_ORIENTATION=-
MKQAATAPPKSGKVVNSLPEWDPTNWTPARLHHNSNIFRAAAIVLALVWVSGSPTKSLYMSRKAAATTHILAFGTWFGTMLYTTFVAGITMYRNLPRQTFGKLQSKLFPKYFVLCTISVILQLATVSFMPSALASKATKALGTGLVMTLLNQLWLEPTSTTVMFSRYEIENSDDPQAKESAEYKKLASDFGKYHGMSSLANLVALCAAFVHGFYIASCTVA